MTDTVIRRYGAIVRRQWWVILQAVVVVALVAGLLAGHGRQSGFEARAQLYVEPAVGPDGTMPLVPQATFGGTSAPPISPLLGAALVRQSTSEPVLAAAAKALGPSAGGLGGTVSTFVDPGNRSLSIVAKSGSRTNAIALANAVAQSMVSIRTAQHDRLLQTQIASTTTQLRDIRTQLNQIGREETVAKAANTDTASYETARAVYLTQYQTVFATQQQYQGELQSHDNGVQFLLPAESAARGSVPSRTTRALTGAGIGFLLGIGLAALRETLDNRVRDAETAETLSGLEVLAELPEERALRRHPLGVVDVPSSAYAEAMRGLRGAFTWALEESGPASIAVISPQSDDGRTAVAVNLAASFAVAGVSTILVSADFHDPEPDLVTVLGADLRSRAADFGLAELLVNDDEVPHGPRVEAALLATRVEGLRWLPLASSTSSPALAMRASEILSSARVRKLLVTLTHMAEVIVVDTSPAVFSDAMGISSLVDGSLLVVRVGSTRRAALERTLHALKGSPAMPLGLLVNRVRAGRGPDAPPRGGRRRGPRLPRRRSRRVSTVPPAEGL